MKESYGKGIANHPGPEPCEGSREAALEALDRVYVGWVLSSENWNAGCRRRQPARKAIQRCALARAHRGPAESKIASMHRNSMRENRETPLPPASSTGGPVGESDER